MISIILPVYNVEKYLSKCIDTIINQTYKDLEIICINDGSTDGSLKILEEYAEEDSRIIVINQENQGQGIARNKAINMAQGEYILFVDPDDWIELDTIESAYTIAKSNNAQVVQFNYQTYNEETCQYYKFNLAQQLLNLSGYNLDKKKFYNYKVVKRDCLHSFDMHVVNRLYLTEFLRKNNIMFSNGRYGEDWLFSIGTLIKAENIYYLDKYNYYYRIRKTSSCNSKNKYVMEIFKIFDDVKKLLCENSLLDDLQTDFENFKVQCVLWALPCIPNDLLNEFYKNIQIYLTYKDYKFVKKLITKQKIKQIKTDFKRKVKNIWKNIISR